ncbi:uncharacterized protein FIBRA_02040 [Fibroporia radiculosa]|uniref:F-box domain-containing protein n=1 Tax=Fibroporia radiculosa TaxID=599839 RepID=J4H1M1_9APHY|nr:uncharacterized protein FIBRA_02040 [Fibroporia radiculosa]CCM00014.1 predicted protein [Fibroporia radiculosa]
MSACAIALPIELWLYIFRLATISSLTHRLCATTYGPFETASLIAQDDKDAVKTKSALVRVCRQWRALTLDLFYEDLWIGSPERLVQLLTNEERQEIGGRGKWVRRANLPYTSSTTVRPRRLDAIEILEQCPRLEILVRIGPFRPDVDLRFEFPTECPPLPSLKRLDWWHLSDAARSGGINSLGDVLQAAPNLLYLSLGGYVRFTHLTRSLISLPFLETLRILRLNVLFVQQTCRWSLPGLRHLIIDTVEDISILESFWEAFGAQLRTVELGPSLSYYVYDSLSYILPGCPQLKALNYHIHFTAVPSSFRDTFGSLTTVGLHAHPNLLLPPESVEYWRRFQEHFAMLSGPAFPALKEVFLYGDWDSVVEDIRYPFLVQPLLSRHCIIEHRL